MKELTSAKTVLFVILAILTVIAASIGGELIALLPYKLGVPTPVCIAVSGIMYIVLAMLILRLFGKKLKAYGIEDIGLSRPVIKPVWIITALALPLSVTVIFLLMGGSFADTGLTSLQTAETAAQGIFSIALGAGIVEEAVFRGAVMSILMKKYGKRAAVIVPSVIFAAVHILGESFDIISCIQVIAAGTAVGIMFSLIALESGSVWNGAIVHSIWNLVICGGFLYIGVSPSSDAVRSFVLNTDNILLTGGQFGIESSVIAAAAYVIVCVIALTCIKGKAPAAEHCPQ